MERTIIATLRGQIPSDAFNVMQERACGLRPAEDGATSNDLPNTGTIGSDGRTWQTKTTIPVSELRIIDDTIDWSDRYVVGVVGSLAADERIGGDGDYVLGQSSSPMALVNGYLGKQCYSNFTTGAEVSNGNPPAPGHGAYHSNAVLIVDVDSGVWLYVDGDGKLCVYNHTNAAVHLLLVLHFISGPTGKRP